MKEVHRLSKRQTILEWLHLSGDVLVKAKVPWTRATEDRAVFFDYYDDGTVDLKTKKRSQALTMCFILKPKGNHIFCELFWTVALKFAFYFLLFWHKYPSAYSASEVRINDERHKFSMNTFKTGSKAGSSSCPTFSNRTGFPKRRADSKFLNNSLSLGLQTTRPSIFPCKK